MDRFPENFSFEYSNVEVPKIIDKLHKAELETTRSYIYNQFTKYLNNGSGYFFIDLRKNKPYVRATVMEEVACKFKDILHTYKTKQIGKNLIPLALFPEETGKNKQENIYRFYIFHGKWCYENDDGKWCHDNEEEAKMDRLLKCQVDDNCAFIIGLTKDFIEKTNYLSDNTGKRYCVCLD